MSPMLFMCIEDIFFTLWLVFALIVMLLKEEKCFSFMGCAAFVFLEIFSNLKVIISFPVFSNTEKPYCFLPWHSDLYSTWNLFMCMIWSGGQVSFFFFFLNMRSQLTQYPLLRRPSFPVHLIINRCLYMHVSVSRLPPCPISLFA